MPKLAIWAQMEAKAGKEQEVAEFLKSAQPLAEKEAGTITWYAIRLGGSGFGIFDTFADERTQRRPVFWVHGEPPFLFISLRQFVGQRPVCQGSPLGVRQRDGIASACKTNRDPI